VTVTIVGTGTDVGKTHVACALLHHLGARAIGWKPICAGGIGDVEALAAACGARIDAFYALKRPVSPHLAAREEGVAIDVERIQTRARELDRERVLVLETAGGLFTPLGANVVNEDLALGKIVLVAPDRLGVLHDVGAVVRAAKRIDAIVLSAPALADASTGSNAAEVGAVAVFPRAKWDAPESVAAAAALWARISA